MPEFWNEFCSRISQKLKEYLSASLWSTDTAPAGTYLWMLTGTELTQWLINVEEYESLIKSSISTGNLISLVFYFWEMLRRELKMHPTASSTLILSDMNFLLVYNQKGLERNALVNTYSTRVSNYITCFKILFSNAQSSGQPGGSPALYFHQQWWCTGLSPAYLSPPS